MASESVPWIVAVLLAAPVSSAQSLAEVAKKEKERRAKVARDEPAPVIGEEALAASPGQTLSITGRRSKPADDDPEKTDEPFATEGTDGELTEREIRDLRAKWAEVWKEQLRGAERELELAKDAVYQCNKASVFFFVPLAIDCNGVHDRLAIAEYRLKEIRANQYNWELLLPERTRAPPTN